MARLHQELREERRARETALRRELRQELLAEIRRQRVREHGIGNDDDGPTEVEPLQAGHGQGQAGRFKVGVGGGASGGGGGAGAADGGGVVTSRAPSMDDFEVAQQVSETLVADVGGVLSTRLSALSASRLFEGALSPSSGRMDVGGEAAWGRNSPADE